MAFNDLHMKVTSEFALQSLHNKLLPILDFAHNFRELEGRVGEAIVIPNFSLSAASEFNADSNNYFGGEKEVEAVTVNLNKHFVKSCMYEDRDLVETDANFVRDYGIGIGDTLGRAAYSYVINMINETNCPLSASFSGSTKQNFADLFATVYEKDMDIGQTILMLTPTYYAKLLGTLDANVYGGAEAIKSGRIAGLYGFKAVVCSPNMVDGLKGALVDANAIGVAGRFLPAMAGAYVSNWKASDPISGLPIGFREGVNLATGRRYLAGEILLGARVIRSSGVVRLV